MDLRMCVIMLLLRLAPFSMADRIQKSCITFEEEYTFDEDRFTGKWYEIRRLDDPEDTFHEECVQEKYTRSSNMMDFEIIRSMQLNDTDELIYSTGRAAPRVYENSAVPKFFLRYNITHPADPDIPIDIVKTDYHNYAIVYSCDRLNASAVLETAWILSRSPSISRHTADAINKFVRIHFNHPEHKWRITDQSETFCKPTIITANGARSAFGVPFLQSFSQLLVIVLLSKLFSG